MIISVSRRTDIPALYSPWFFNRLKEQYVLVRNPVNFHQISRVPLSPQVVDAHRVLDQKPCSHAGASERIERL